jgi:limonene-1,2-epoxide hydrolase
MSLSHEELIIEDFFGKWQVGPACEGVRVAIETYLTEDSVWRVPGTDAKKGEAAALAVADALAGSGVDAVEVEVTALIGRGDIVFVERRDHLQDVDGVEKGTADVCSVFTLQDRKIADWHDYPADPTSYPYR